MSSSSPPPSSAVANNQSQIETSFKDRLDRAAEDARHPNDGKRHHQPNLAEKVAKYIPPVAKLLGIKTPGTRQPRSPDLIPGPPERPRDDRHIEEFVRDQHKSEKADGGAIGSDK
ncbi:hypothetical protein F4820DRAFT_454198 [Hypoxylon rubiginosum]|uniref:Uncharacterized protein n=1 Tax=Hypoxylon rubiginosum TaxID=110542 RepID=A0ACB9YIY4_9PEZI|nr:hypothetical protein F4820DRAFT_454198 [Hypoxylon rubiginosum]